MNELLKGNFKPRNTVTQDKASESIEERFEREALKKLGGSISFVKKKKVKWADDSE